MLIIKQSELRKDIQQAMKRTNSITQRKTKITQPSQQKTQTRDHLVKKQLNLIYELITNTGKKLIILKKKLNY